jgi:hypothetical protein
MTGGTNNNQLKAQLCPAHNGNKDDMPRMCLAVVVVVAMMVWEGGRAMATVEEVVMAAAEEADDGRGGQHCAVYSFLVQLFFSPSPPLSLKAKATVRPLLFLPQTLFVDCCLCRFHHFHHCRCRWCCNHCHRCPHRHRCPCHHHCRHHHHARRCCPIDDSIDVDFFLF